MCVQGGVGLLTNGLGQAFGTDEDDRVQVMGIGAKAATFGGRQLEGRHARIIDPA
jgi:hypothetical protein